MSWNTVLQKCALVLIVASPFAKANFILDPAGGVSVGFAPDAVDDGVTRDLGGTFDLYGNPITKIGVASNGFLGTVNVSGFFFDRSLPVLADASEGPVISAFFDHTALGPGSSVTEQTAGSYYALSYQNLYAFDDITSGFTTDYQIILFLGNTTLSGFDFQSGDIAISYGRIASVPEGSFTVGVAQSPQFFTGTPLTVDGELNDSSSLPTGNQFFLYRPEEVAIINAIRGSGLANSLEEGERVDYSVSVESTVTPEPGTLALAGLALLVPMVLRRKFRRGV